MSAEITGEGTNVNLGDTCEVSLGRNFVQLLEVFVHKHPETINWINFGKKSCRNKNKILENFSEESQKK